MKLKIHVALLLVLAGLLPDHLTWAIFGISLNDGAGNPIIGATPDQLALGAGVVALGAGLGLGAVALSNANRNRGRSRGRGFRGRGRGYRGRYRGRRQAENSLVDDQTEELMKRLDSALVTIDVRNLDGCYKRLMCEIYATEDIASTLDFPIDDFTLYSTLSWTASRVFIGMQEAVRVGRDAQSPEVCQANYSDCRLTKDQIASLTEQYTKAFREVTKTGDLSTVDMLSQWVG